MGGNGNYIAESQGEIRNIDFLDNLCSTKHHCLKANRKRQTDRRGNRQDNTKLTIIAFYNRFITSQHLLHDVFDAWLLRTRNGMLSHLRPHIVNVHVSRLLGSLLPASSTAHPKQPIAQTQHHAPPAQESAGWYVIRNFIISVLRRLHRCLIDRVA